MGSLTGKVAIITGAGQGIGLGIAQAYAKEGAQLVITGRDAAKLEVAAAALRDLGAAVLVVAGDARRRSDAVATVNAALDKFGRVDILVNNAQSSTPGIALEDVDDDTFAMTLESGLMGTFHFMQSVFPLMKAQGGGVIINFASRTGIEGSPGFGPYAATKEAIRGLSRVAAKEWGRHGIRINVICPAALTPAAATYLDANPEKKATYLTDIPLGRFGDPESDIGRVAVALAGSDFSYVTGQTINVDGGLVVL